MNIKTPPYGRGAGGGKELSGDRKIVQTECRVELAQTMLRCSQSYLKRKEHKTFWVMQKERMLSLAEKPQKILLSRNKFVLLQDEIKRALL